MSELALIDSIPIELFLRLFKYFSTTELVRIRAVSNRWKNLVDEIINCEYYWKKKCKNDFANVVQIARFKCRVGMDWSDLYRSLSLWSKFLQANEEQDEFCSATIVANEIRSFTILRNGIVGVHRRSSIVYYDIETYRPCYRSPITGDYLRYAENDDVIAVLGFHLQLYVIKKINLCSRFPYSITCDDVKTFILLRHCVYYINMADNIHIVTFQGTELQDHMICHSPEGIMSMGFKNNKLQLLTFHRRVFTLVEDKLVFIEMVGTSPHLIHQLNQYNLLEMLDWRIYFQWMFVLNYSVPTGPLQDIVSTKVYGDVVFIGSNWGVLRIYYQPYSQGVFDIYNTQPIKQYNFMERYDCPVLSMCPILGIDVYEVDNGHTVIVAMPKKLAVLSYMHNITKSHGAALRCRDIPETLDFAEQEERMRIITIE